MASLIRKQNKAYIQLSPGENKLRPTISLGRCTLKDARAAKANIETLANRIGTELPDETQKWLSGISDGLRERLEKLGLIERSKKNKWTVSAFVADYIQRRTDVKEPTRRKWRDVESKLNIFFDKDNIGDITAQQAKNFRIYLQSEVKLSENTLRRHIGIARQFFNAAIDAELITRNPFRGQPVSVRANDARFFYVTPTMAQKVLDACPDAQWRLIFGLARYGGLRCPSEVLRLKWTDIDFEHDRFTVHASKTEHHADGGIRTVPMFPELKPLFEESFNMAFDKYDRNSKTPFSEHYCIEKTRDTGVNLRTHMMRIIRRAGLEPWPKLFQNLRSTRETELFKITGGKIKSVCEWIGNSPEVALKHYAQVTEADMKEAAKMTVLNDAEKAVHNPMQEGSKTSGNVREENLDLENQNSISPDNHSNLPNISEPERNKTNDVHWAIRDSNQNTQRTAGKALNESTPRHPVQKSVHDLDFLPDLAEKWDRLTEAQRQGILDLLK